MPNQTDNFPTIKPSLLLDFGNSRRFDPRITVKRASSATYFDRLGILRTAPANEGRIGFDPATLECLGMMSEEQRTNLVANNTMGGGVASTGVGDSGTSPSRWDGLSQLNGVDTRWLGFGVQNGIEFADLNLSGKATVSGNATFKFDSALISATVGQTYTASAFVQLLSHAAGDVKLGLRFDERNTNNVGTSFGQPDIALSGANLSGARHSFTHTITQSDTVGFFQRFRISLVAGVDYNFTIRIGLPQFELGAHASSPIKTSGTQVTRAADLPKMDGQAFSSWYTPAGGTLMVEYAPVSDRTAESILHLDDGTGSNFVRFRYNSSGTGNDAAVIVGGVGQASPFSTLTVTNGVFYRDCFSFKTNQFIRSLNGSQIGTTDTIGTLPVVNVFGIGTRSYGGETFNGYIRKVAFYPVAFDAPTCNAITA